MTYEILKFLHVVGATVLLGTGAGIAFFMVISIRSRDPALVAHVAGIVVLADAVFTATAAVAQPITGALLAWHMGYSLLEGWLGVSLLLYIVVGFFWLPVVVIQIRLRDLARKSRDTGEPLSADFYRLFRIWLGCGFPAFLSVLVIIWLMLNKPMF